MTMDDGTYKTLTLLELTGDAPVTATANRSAALLQRLVDSKFVTTAPRDGDAWMSITNAGRQALEEHRRTLS